MRERPPSTSAEPGLAPAVAPVNKKPTSGRRHQATCGVRQAAEPRHNDFTRPGQPQPSDRGPSRAVNPRSSFEHEGESYFADEPVID
jgi:hypothetical protein